MKRLIAIVIFLVLPVSCSGSDSHLRKVAQDIFSQKTWQAPLPPNEFKTDGCSCFPDDGWADCCVEHDIIYWMGGTREERKQADVALEYCVSQKGHPHIARIMYYGVRLGGIYWLPTPFRWGFGWGYPRSGPPDKKY